MTINWTTWNKTVVEKHHDKVWFYRKLYNGDHAELFGRANDLIEKGEIVGNILEGRQKTLNVQAPYIIANVSKLIPEIPAMLVSRTIGKIKSSIASTDEQNKAANAETDEIIEGAQGANNSEIDNLQDELIKQITKNSNLQFEHYGNILQHQIDGGIVGVPWKDERGLRIDFKMRDVYFPHEDGLGADLAYERRIDEVKYLHVYRERIEGNNLKSNHFLYELKGDATEEIKDPGIVKEKLGIDQLEITYIGRSRPFIVYWANEKNFMSPLGSSCLKNQESKQDEINWTLTSAALTFMRNGKPRIAISKEIFEALKEKAFERYGFEGAPLDHRDLELTTFDDNGKAMEVIQIDITKIGNMEWVKDQIKLMLMETKTSEKAVDFYMDSGANGSISGVAKFYDLFISIIKAEQLQSEYVAFLQQLYENCLWLANNDDDNVTIEEPEIQLNGMIPISKKELIEENMNAFNGVGVNGRSAQSLETTVRRNNPHASEEWIEEELARIEEEKQSDDSTSLAVGRQTLTNLQDNRDAQGNVIEDEG
ncbi:MULTISPECIES: hypothetical protein [Peribacillus]|uniref:hypothetical protein n=1 Tax=Peribacillus TaxID=2675229 RepID=UPI001F4E284C|nr:MULTISPECIES: hypothetical protein [unclassified Peribacillus]MCK1982220.1 hypothetical protein [Peribacillus sp. Aquil_B1]MCK2007428.1 hypothetical protein [Peribacillus sp. Aquil_B8]